MRMSVFWRKSVAAASILLLVAMLFAAATFSVPTVVAAPSPPYTYNPSSQSLPITSEGSASFDLTVALSFDPEPGWWVETVVEAMSPGPFTFVFEPQSFTLNGTTPSQVVHITVTAPKGTEPGAYSTKIKAKQVTTSGPPGVGLGEGCAVTSSVLGTPNSPPTPREASCFIATAAYGTPLAEEIQVLRQFRDEYLVTNPAGQLFVSLYYRGSPPVAEFIDDHPALKPMVRVGLMPAVALSAVAINAH